MTGRENASETRRWWRMPAATAREISRKRKTFKIKTYFAFFSNFLKNMIWNCTSFWVYEFILITKIFIHTDLLNNFGFPIKRRGIEIISTIFFYFDRRVRGQTGSFECKFRPSWKVVQLKEALDTWFLK